MLNLYCGERQYEPEVICDLGEVNQLGALEHVTDEEFEEMKMQPPPVETRQEHDPPFEDCSVGLHTPRQIRELLSNVFPCCFVL